VPNYHCINCYYAYELPDYAQELEVTVNIPDTINNTQYGIGKTLAMSKDEVEEDASEGIAAFTTEGTEAFKVKGTEVIEEEGTDAFQEKVKSTTRADKGQVERFEQFL